MIWLPSFEQVCLLHQKVIAATGGSGGIRDQGLIESALFRAQSSFGGVEVYASLESKAAAVCCGLIQNHGFVDGNKRIGITCMLLILLHNGKKVSYSQQELIDLGLAVAQSQMDVEDVEAWINAREVIF